ncbi:MAG: hypothetical protein JSS00_10385 [Proteobacteria bacterium]|nr:hypothetical protein [Pseudomonadota bacterium]
MADSGAGQITGNFRMKKQIAFLGAAAAALMTAGTAHADGGYAGVAYSDNTTAGFHSWSVNGAYASQNFQIDGGYSRVESSVDVFDIGGHLFSRNDQWLWGGFLGYDHFSGSGSAGEWTGALQTQFYLPRTTFSADLSYSQTTSLPTDIKTTQIDGEARFFGTDNFSIQGNLGYGHVDSSGIGSGNYWTSGVGAEYQFDAAPISLYGGWQGYNVSGGTDANAWTIGVRYNWGGTLLQRNRSGAGLNSPHGFLSAIF